ncbi:MAG: tripartite tricarboxylate transporter substrate binding protein [Burkholderiaceae bacterium]
MKLVLGGIRLLACAAMLAAGAASHAAFPDKPIKLIVPYTPGGITDNVARSLADGLGRELKQPVVVDNKPGAGAMVGTGIAARSPADGYTLLIATNGNLVTTPMMTKKLTYDVEKDLRVIAVVGEIPLIALGNMQNPANDMKGFAAFGKANAGKVNYASLGQGNVIYLATRRVEADLGITMTEVPYKGSVPALTALMGNEVQFYIDTLPSALQLVRSGKLKALGVPMDSRIQWLPDVPTLREQGLPAFHAASWLGIAVPAATPPDVVNTLQAAIARHVRDDAFRTTFTNAGLLVLPPMSLDKVDAYIKADRERWGELVRKHNITID